MNNLKKMTTYLVGSIDRCPNNGIQWRESITPWLESRGVTVFNPNSKPFMDHHGSDAEARKEINKLKLEGKFKEIREKYSYIRTCDLRMVDKADFIIANIDTKIYSVGTYEEITLANRQKKPILCHLVNGFDDCPNWLILMLPHEFFFDSWTNMKVYLDHVNLNLKPNLNRWYYYR